MVEIMLHPKLEEFVGQVVAKSQGGASLSPWDAQRVAACHWARQLGMPSRKGEAYRYADLSRLFAGDYTYAPNNEPSTQPPQAVFQCDLPKLDAHTLFLINGAVYTESGAPRVELPGGAVYGSASGAMASHAELFPVLVQSELTDGLAAMAMGLAPDGYFIYVPAGVHLDRPIQVVSLLQGDQDRLVATRSAIIMEPGARAEVVICSHSLSAASFLDNALLSCDLAEGASLELTVMQNTHNMTAQLQHVYAAVQGNAQLHTKTLTIHGGFTRNNITVELQAPHAECHLGGMALIDGTQYADTQTVVHHRAPNCHSNQLYKNIVDGQAESTFYGIINVHRDAQFTTAYQRAASIMLTERGSVHARPQLVIHADDVKCSHGATVGQLDDNARFYLRSRGISAADVDRMLLNAFVGDVLRDIKLAPLKERVESIVEKRLRGERDRCHAGCAGLM